MPDEPPATAALRVAMLFRHFHPVLAGAARRFQRYGPGLRQRGVELLALTGHDPESLPETDVSPEGVGIYRVPVAGAGNGFDDRRYFAEVTQRLLDGRVQADVAQVAVLPSFAVPHLWRLRRSGLGLVHVATMVGEPPPSSLWKRWRAQVRHRLFMSPFHRLVVSSSVMAGWHRAFGLNLDRIRVIPNGVDVHRFSPAADPSQMGALRADLGLSSDDRVLLFVANLLPRKGLHVLLEAMPEILARHPRTRLLIVGEFERPTVINAGAQTRNVAYRQEIEQRFAALPPDNVRWLHERSDVEQLFRIADVFVLPSEQEGMGNVVLEAMASAVPCLLTRYLGLPTTEFGVEGTHFLATERSPAALALALNDLLDHPKQCRAMGQAARDWAVRELNMERILDAFAQVYRECR